MNAVKLLIMYWK